MKARAFVETEVEVEISAADAIAAILELPDPAEHIFEANQVLNRLYAIAKRIPDELIEKMTDKARAVIADGLAEQAARYRKAMLAATSTGAK